MSVKIKCGVWNGHPAKYAHAKYDGNFVRVAKYATGRVQVTTSLPTDITEEMPTRLLANVHRYVPGGTVLLGELRVRNAPASEVKTALKAKRDDLALTYFAIEQTMNRFDHGTDLARAELEEVQLLCDGWGLPFAEFVKLKDGWSPEGLLHAATVACSEGWVLKDGNLLNWRKLKHKRTVDAIVTGYEDGEGKYLGLLGALRVSLRSRDGLSEHEIANVSGMTDAERVAMSDDPDALLGRVVEVEYQYVGAGGRLRHPRFVRWREDKLAAACDVTQDPQLEAYYDAKH